MRRQILPALGTLLVFTVLTGLLYPLAITALAQTAFEDEADGSLIERDGVVVGSSWIGQPFSEPQYFHPRPSATGYAPGPGYAYGSNEGPTSERLLDEVERRVEAYRRENHLPADARVPVDAVTGSASGLDPHISVANARIQARRVADERGLDLAVVLQLVDDHTDGRWLGIIGEPGVRVLELNLALDGR